MRRLITDADPGFLARGLRCLNRVWFSGFTSFFQKFSYEHRYFCPKGGSSDLDLCLFDICNKHDFSWQESRRLICKLLIPSLEKSHLTRSLSVDSKQITERSIQPNPLQLVYLLQTIQFKEAMSDISDTWNHVFIISWPAPIFVCRWSLAFVVYLDHGEKRPPCGKWKLQAMH